MQTGSPLLFRLHKVVVVVLQLAQIVPSLLEVVCIEKENKIIKVSWAEEKSFSGFKTLTSLRFGLTSGLFWPFILR